MQQQRRSSNSATPPTSTPPKSNRSTTTPSSSSSSTPSSKPSSAPPSSSSHLPSKSTPKGSPAHRATPAVVHTKTGSAASSSSGSSRGDRKAEGNGTKAASKRGNSEGPHKSVSSKEVETRKKPEKDKNVDKDSAKPKSTSTVQASKSAERTGEEGRRKDRSEHSNSRRSGEGGGRSSKADSRSTQKSRTRTKESGNAPAVIVPDEGAGKGDAEDEDAEIDEEAEGEGNDGSEGADEDEGEAEGGDEEGEGAADGEEGGHEEEEEFITASQKQRATRKKRELEELRQESQIYMETMKRVENKHHREEEEKMKQETRKLKEREERRKKKKERRRERKAREKRKAKEKEIVAEEGEGDGEDGDGEEGEDEEEGEEEEGTELGLERMDSDRDEEDSEEEDEEEKDEGRGEPMDEEERERTDTPKRRTRSSSQTKPPGSSAPSAKTPGTSSSSSSSTSSSKVVVDRRKGSDSDGGKPGPSIRPKFVSTNEKTGLAVVSPDTLDIVTVTSAELQRAFPSYTWSRMLQELVTQTSPGALERKQPKNPRTKHYTLLVCLACKSIFCTQRSWSQHRKTKTHANAVIEWLKKRKRSHSSSAAETEPHPSKTEKSATVTKTKEKQKQSDAKAKVATREEDDDEEDEVNSSSDEEEEEENEVVNEVAEMEEVRGRAESAKPVAPVNLSPALATAINYPSALVTPLASPRIAGTSVSSSAPIPAASSASSVSSSTTTDLASTQERRWTPDVQELLLSHLPPSVNENTPFESAPFYDRMVSGLTAQRILVLRGFCKAAGPGWKYDQFIGSTPRADKLAGGTVVIEPEREWLPLRGFVEAYGHNGHSSPAALREEASKINPGQDKEVPLPKLGFFQLVRYLSTANMIPRWLGGKTVRMWPSAIVAADGAVSHPFCDFAGMINLHVNVGGGIIRLYVWPPNTDLMKFPWLLSTHSLVHLRDQMRETGALSITLCPGDAVISYDGFPYMVEFLGGTTPEEPLAMFINCIVLNRFSLQWLHDRARETADSPVPVIKGFLKEVFGPCVKTIEDKLGLEAKKKDRAQMDAGDVADLDVLTAFLPLLKQELRRLQEIAGETGLEYGEERYEDENVDENEEEYDDEEEAEVGAEEESQSSRVYAAPTTSASSDSRKRKQVEEVEVRSAKGKERVGSSASSKHTQPRKQVAQPEEERGMKKVTRKDGPPEKRRKVPSPPPLSFRKGSQK